LGIMYYLYDKNQIAYLEYCKTQQIALEQCSLLDKLASDFKTINYFWIFMVFVGFGMTNYSRTIRWRIILKTLNYDARFYNLFGAVNIAYLANLGLPRIGEFVRAAVLSKYEKLPFDKVFGTVVVDRIADMISFLLLVLLAVLLDTKVFINFFTNYANIPDFNFNIIYLASALLILFTIWKFRSVLLKMHIISKLYQFLKGIWTGVISIRNLEDRNLFLLHTLLIWVWFFLMFYFACQAFPPTSSLDLIPMLVVYVFGSFGVFIPSPGGMGTYHFMVILGLGLYGLNQADAFSFANIAFASAQFFALVIFGIFSLILLYWKNRTSAVTQTVV
jgi:glycosyltransferase 2 family protein